MKPRLTVLILLVLLGGVIAAQAREAGHVVRSGETAYDLCRQHNITMAQFRALNPHVNANCLKAGESVRFDGVAAPVKADEPAPAPSAKTRASSASAVDHVVRSGETAGSICQRYRITMSEFQRLNPGVNANLIQAGQAIRVGGAAKPARKQKAPPQPSRATAQVTESARTFEATAPDPEPRAARPEEPKNTADAPAVASPAKPEAKPAAEVAAKPKPKAKNKDTGYLSYYDTPAGTAKDTEPSVTVSLVRVVLSLIFVVALAYLSLLALKKFSSSTATQKSPRRNIRVLETTGLGTNRALHVVQIDGRQLLVGSTASQVNLIAELGPVDTEESTADQPAGFTGIFKRLSGSQQQATAASKLSALLQDGASFLQQKSGAASAMRKKGEPDEA